MIRVIKSATHAHVAEYTSWWIVWNDKKNIGILINPAIGNLKSIYNEIVTLADNVLMEEQNRLGVISGYTIAAFGRVPDTETIEKFFAHCTDISKILTLCTIEEVDIQPEGRDAPDNVNVRTVI